MRTIAVGTGRLTVHRNGSPLFSYDDASHFIGSGRPGIGMHATTAISLDDWEGGELLPGQVALPPNPSTARDDFNRADGGLGSAWRGDPLWGSGMTISANQVQSSVGNGGAYYWNGWAFGQTSTRRFGSRGYRGVDRGGGQGHRAVAGVLGGGQGRRCMALFVPGERGLPFARA